jgi:hypothetical protein
MTVPGGSGPVNVGPGQAIVVGLIAARLLWGAPVFLEPPDGTLEVVLAQLAANPTRAKPLSDPPSRAELERAVDRLA